ncbi:MAG: RDD family protein [Dehalococcoidia bacterium]
MKSGTADNSIRLRRSGALLIDVAPFWLLAAVVPSGNAIVAQGAILLILAYRIGFAAMGRATLGKQLLGLSVLSRNYQRPPRLRVIARDVPYLAVWIAAVVTEFLVRTQANASVFDEVKPALVMLMLINVACWDLLVILVTGKYSLHDFLAGTRVVDAQVAIGATPV